MGKWYRELSRGPRPDSRTLQPPRGSSGVIEMSDTSKGNLREEREGA